jgi:hypothetical protein
LAKEKTPSMERNPWKWRDTDLISEYNDIIWYNDIMFFEYKNH